MQIQRLRLAGTSPVKRAGKNAKTLKFVEESSGKNAKDLGLPTREEFNDVVQEYINSLSIRKREKALVPQQMFDDVWDVLQDPANAKIRTPQFRFWVRKMFVLSSVSAYALGKTDDDTDMVPVILHEGRPVAVREQIYDILSYYHMLTGHGGRDRTMAEVRDNYSWVPKELVARYIKACPTCVFRRTGIATRMPARRLSTEHEVSFIEHRGSRSSPSDGYDSETISSSYSQAVSLASSEEGFVVNPSLMPSRPPLPRPVHTLASLMDSRILPVPVLSPALRSPPLKSPNLSADPRKWLADLTMQPGPNCVGSLYKFPPLRRTGSENDGDPIRRPSTSVVLPPLMKALSEGMADPDVPRPAFNVPNALSIPMHTSYGSTFGADIDMVDATAGMSSLFANPMDDDYSNIDPVLLGGAPVVNTYDSYAQQSKDKESLYDMVPVNAFSADVHIPGLVPFTYCAPPLQRSVSEDSVSSAASSGKSVQGLNGQASLVSDRRVSSVSAKTTDGMQQSSSFDAQDWESSYCLEDV